MFLGAQGTFSCVFLYNHTVDISARFPYSHISYNHPHKNVRNSMQTSQEEYVRYFYISRIRWFGIQEEAWFFVEEIL